MNYVIWVGLSIIASVVLFFLIDIIVSIATKAKLRTYKQFMKEEEKDGKKKA